MSIFIPHGELVVRRSGQIMIVEGRGPWNLEAMKRSEEAAAQVLAELKGRPWGVIIIIHGEPVHVPDAEEKLVELVKHDIQNGRCGSALLLTHCSAPSFALTHFGKIYRAAGEEFTVCDSFEECETWVQSRVDNANS